MGGGGDLGGGGEGLGGGGAGLGGGGLGLLGGGGGKTHAAVPLAALPRSGAKSKSKSTESRARGAIDTKAAGDVAVDRSSQPAHSPAPPAAPHFTGVLL